MGNIQRKVQRVQKVHKRVQKKTKRDQKTKGIGSVRVSKRKNAKKKIQRLSTIQTGFKTIRFVFF